MTSSKIFCPKCDREVASIAENPNFPFCSRRCKLLDLGSWLSGTNAIETTLEESDLVELEESELDDKLSH